jgi:hypothetical protein
VRLEGLGRLTNLIRLIGSGTGDLPDCRILPQPLHYRVSRDTMSIKIFHSAPSTVDQPTAKKEKKKEKRKKKRKEKNKKKV